MSKIAEGCDRTCSFCAIPSFRGKQKSRPIESVVEEIKTLVQQGVQEINLIAQELNGYGRDLPWMKNEKRKPDLADLLIAIENISPGPRWVRLHYLYPYKFTPRMVRVIANSNCIVPYLDMPLQHISDPLLKRMRRAGSSAHVKRLLEDLRSQFPHLTLRTTFLVGFPGETEQDFLELEAFIQEQHFDRVGIFSFSREEGTHSFDLDKQVPENIQEERRSHLYNIQKDISKKNLKKYLGKKIEVLVEGVSEESEWLLEGRFAGQAPEIDGTVYINDGKANPGDFVNIQVEQTGEHDLVGGIVS